MRGGVFLLRVLSQLSVDSVLNLQADVCVVLVGAHSSEGEDRRNLSLNILHLALVEGILA